MEFCIFLLVHSELVLCNFRFNAMGNHRANQFSKHIFSWNYRFPSLARKIT